MNSVIRTTSHARMPRRTTIKAQKTPSARLSLSYADLQTWLETHQQWLSGGQSRTRLDLRNTDISAALRQNSAGVVALFQGANLTDADLSDCEGLTPDLFRGATLIRTKLPDAISRFDSLSGIKELSHSAGTIFVTLITTCAFLILSAATLNDLDLLTDAGKFTLPVINFQVSTRAFFGLTPYIVLAIYTSLHFYLQRCWEQVATLPAFFPDGGGLKEKLDPWIASQIIRISSVNTNQDTSDRNAQEDTELGSTDGTSGGSIEHVDSPLAITQAAIYTFLVFLFAPLTVLYLWWRCACSQNFVFSGIQGVALGLILMECALFFRIRRSTFDGDYEAIARLHQDERNIIVPIFCLIPLLGITSFFRFIPADVSGLEIATEAAKSKNLDDFVAIPPQVDLKAHIAARRTNDRVANSYRSVGVKLFGMNLSGLRAAHSSLRGANLKNTKLYHADFRDTDMRAALLRGSQLIRADFRAAYLRKVDFRRANLEKADFRAAYLREADFRGAYLANADLRGAVLVNAILTEDEARDLIYGSDHAYDYDSARQSAAGEQLSHINTRYECLYGARVDNRTIYPDGGSTHPSVYTVRGYPIDVANASDQKLYIQEHPGEQYLHLAGKDNENKSVVPNSPPSALITNPGTKNGMSE